MDKCGDMSMHLSEKFNIHRMKHFKIPIERSGEEINSLLGKAVPRDLIILHNIREDKSKIVLSYSVIGT